MKEMRKEELPDVSIVVIGMNEEENLEAAFLAINNIDYPQEKVELIYVDTGSSDNSVKIAMRYTNKVFIERCNWPTPGLARNKGLIEASHDIVHFIDGDIQIDKNYLKEAVEKLKAPNLHAVYGYLEEKSNKGLNKILISHWHRKKSGFSDATGGGGTYKKENLLKVNGYDERIKKGQETELGERFRKAGYNIWLLNTLMGTHNYGVKNIFDYFVIRLKQGKSSAYNSLIKNNNNSVFLQMNKKSCRNNIFFNLYFFFIVIISIYFNNPVYLFISIFLYIIYIIIKYKYIKGIEEKNILLGNFLMILTKPIFLLGQMIVFRNYIFIEKIKKQKYIKEKSKISSLKHNHGKNLNKPGNFIKI